MSNQGRLSFLYLLLFLVLHQVAPAQGVGINEDGSLPDSSAVLDLKSSSKSLLVPCLATADRLQIHGPASGLLIYHIDTQSFWYKADTS